MQITVGSTKVAKTGTNKRGAWELIIVTSQDGTDYRTFHKGVKSLASDTVIDIGEPEIEEGKISFKEYTIVSEAPEPELPAQTRQTFTPYQSEIEARAKNTALMQACELAKADKVDKGEILAWANKFLIWLQVGYKLGTGPETTVQQGEELFDEVEGGITTDELLNWVATNMGWRDAKTARTWIVNVCKISEEKIDNDPAGCKEEIKTLQGWT